MHTCCTVSTRLTQPLNQAAVLTQCGVLSHRCNTTHHIDGYELPKMSPREPAVKRFYSEAGHNHPKWVKVGAESCLDVSYADSMADCVQSVQSITFEAAGKLQLAAALRCFKDRTQNPSATVSTMQAAWGTRARLSPRILEFGCFKHWLTEILQTFGQELIHKVDANSSMDVMLMLVSTPLDWVLCWQTACGRALAATLLAAGCELSCCQGAQHKVNAAPSLSLPHGLVGLAVPRRPLTSSTMQCFKKHTSTGTTLPCARMQCARCPWSSTVMSK